MSTKTPAPLPTREDRVDVRKERKAFESWWISWCPDRDVPAPASHIFDAWLASARLRHSPAPDKGEDREAAARIIAHQIHPKPWWWKPEYDDSHEPTSVRLRNENLQAVDEILAVCLPYDERVAYEERILAAEMEVNRIKRETGLRVERPFAYCCAEGGGDVDACDCVNKDHGTAWFDAPATPAGDSEGLRAALHEAKQVGDDMADELSVLFHTAGISIRGERALTLWDGLREQIRAALATATPPEGDAK